MSIKPRQFVRTPLYSEAIQVTAENMKEVAEWCQGEIRTVVIPDKGDEGKRYVKVHVFHPLNERYTQAFIDDWVSLENGKFKAFMDRAFRAKFIAVEDFVEDNKKAFKEESVKIDGIFQEPAK